MLLLTNKLTFNASTSGFTESIDYEDYIHLLKLFKDLHDHKIHEMPKCIHILI